MKKLIVLVAILAMALLTAVPAVAQEDTAPKPDLPATEPAVEGVVPPPPEETPPTSDSSGDVAKDTSSDTNADTGSDTSDDTGTVVDTSADTARNTDDNTVEDTSTDSSDKDTSTSSSDTNEDVDGKDTGDKDTSNKDTGSIDQSGNQKADSGDSDQSANISNSGDNVNMCVTVLQVANTGNALNNQEVAQEGSDAGKVDIGGGGNITITPKLIVECRQTILQLVTGQNTNDSSKGSNNKLKGSQSSSTSQSARTSQSKSGGSQVKVISTRADAKAAQKPNAAPRALPRTGGLPIGYLALLGLATGAPLIAGGLLLYRIRR